MKNILILTDFSPNAEHAAEAGVRLASKLHAGILLFYSYQGAPVIPYYGDTLFPAGELTDLVTQHKESLNRLSDRLADELKSIAPGEYIPPIVSQLGEGSLSDNAEAIIKTNDISLVVMGASDEKSIDHILSGSSVKEIMESTSCPVLVIPQKAKAPAFEYIIFATTYARAELNAIRYLESSFKPFIARLELVHVKPYHEEEEPDSQREIDFLEEIAGLNFSGVSNHEISGKDVAGRLSRLVHESQADLLAVYHHQHSYWGRLFEKSLSKQLLSGLKTPLLIFPSKMKFV